MMSRETYLFRIIVDLYYCRFVYLIYRFLFILISRKVVVIIEKINWFYSRNEKITFMVTHIFCWAKTKMMCTSIPPEILKDVCQFQIAVLRKVKTGVVGE